MPKNDHNIGVQENAIFSAKMGKKVLKIVIRTSAPGLPWLS
jgi:hypothetical protein